MAGLLLKTVPQAISNSFGGIHSSSIHLSRSYWKRWKVGCMRNRLEIRSSLHSAACELLQNRWRKTFQGLRANLLQNDARSGS